jgi:uncharacterized repeat protein (TIGR01451 family)
MSSTKKIAITCVCCTLLVLVVRVNAEGIFGGKTIGQRLDNFGHTIFGTGTSEGKEQTPEQLGKDTPKKSGEEGYPPDVSSTRAGSVLRPTSTAKDRSAAEVSPTYVPANRDDRYNAVPPSGTRYANEAQPPMTTQPNRPLLGTSLLDDERNSGKTVESPKQTDAGQSNVGPGRIITPNNQTSPSAQVNSSGLPSSQPIQNRLMQSRTSAFKNPAPVEQRPAGRTDSPIRRDLPTTAENLDPSTHTLPANGNSSRMLELPSEPQVNTSDRYQSGSTLQTKVPGQPTLAKRPGGSEQPRVPNIAQRTTPNVRSEGGSVGVKNMPAETANINPTRAANSPANAKDDALLFTRRGPVLSVETLGPRKIIVGKESVYEVMLLNAGEVAAEEVVVFVSLPEWAEVARAEASSGTPQFTDARQNEAPFQWRVGRLEAKAKEKLSLKIIPRLSKPFDLAVRWDYKPVASQAMIEVQEPKLEMQLEGPRDVFYGKKETYRLKMMNTGTGAADGVVVKLLPVGTGENTPAIYQLGMLPAGESKAIEIELTAREAGELSIQVEAKGDAGVHAELAEKVLVRRAGLEVVVEGPRLQYVGATGTYIVRVRNPGNAPAMNIRFTTTLPAGMKYVGGIEGMRGDAAGTKLQWTLENLNPQLEQVFTLKCRWGAVGTARLDIAVAADDELTTTAGVNTQVDAAASLTLDVQDPAGPISIGEEAIYEVHVRNRGTKEAEGVEVLSYFSRGIEPTGAEGGPNRIGPGQVAFAPLTTLAPGAEAVFKVRAKAETAGNHVFRAEVHCKAMGTRLISEKNTLYYQDSITEKSPERNAPIEANREVLTPENYRTQRR